MSEETKVTTQPEKTERELLREAREQERETRRIEREKREKERAERCKKTWAEWEARGWK